MRFLWFGKKKEPIAVINLEPERAPQEIFSITGFISEPNPLQGGKGSQLDLQTINSYILSIFSQLHSPADRATQEFFQERGAIVLPVEEFSAAPNRGFSGRIIDGERKRTVVIGLPEVIAHASAPFSPALTATSTQKPAPYVVAIDGIAYASFSITSEMV